MDKDQERTGPRKIRKYFFISIYITGFSAGLFFPDLPVYNDGSANLKLKISQTGKFTVLLNGTQNSKISQTGKFTVLLNGTQNAFYIRVFICILGTV
jgi:hypothetical protein